LIENIANSPLGPQIGTDQPLVAEPEVERLAHHLAGLRLDQSSVFQSIGWKRRRAPSTTGSIER
jgi:hypothetical protein